MRDYLLLEKRQLKYADPHLRQEQEHPADTEAGDPAKQSREPKRAVMAPTVSASGLWPDQPGSGGPPKASVQGSQEVKVLSAALEAKEVRLQSPVRCPSGRLDSLSRWHDTRWHVN